MKDYKLGSIVVMKKSHPCGENRWEITRMVIDIIIKSNKCNSEVMLSRIDFEKKLKKVVEI